LPTDDKLATVSSKSVFSLLECERPNAGRQHAGHNGQNARAPPTLRRAFLQIRPTAYEGEREHVARLGPRAVGLSLACAAIVADHGAGVCAFAEGVALGSCLPDSIIVGRIAPIASGFVVRRLGRGGTLVCPERGSFLSGLGVAKTVGNSAALGSESDPPVLAGCGELRFSNRSAASAPAIRICSAVSPVEPDFFSGDLDLVSAGVGDSDGVCAEDGDACLGASGFFSRPTITSCAWACPRRTRLQISALKNAFSMKSRDKPPLHCQALMTRCCRV